MKITAVIVAAGSGTRMGGVMNKVFLPLGDKTVIEHTIDVFSSCESISDIVLVTRECDMELCKDFKNVKVVAGGKTRQESVYLGLLEASDCDIAVIHDGARALITREIVENAIEDAKNFGASAVGVLSKDTLKSVDENGFILKTIDRDTTYQIQTPQIFKRKEIIKAHEMAIKDDFLGTDDCSLYEKYIGKIKITQGSYENIKLTTPDDMLVAENILMKRGSK